MLKLNVEMSANSREPKHESAKNIEMTAIAETDFETYFRIAERIFLTFK